MSLFKGIFGSAKPAPTAGPRPSPQVNTSGSSSIAALLVQQKVPLAPERCGTCGTTFMDPQWMFTLITRDPAGFTLDVGGFCPACSAYRCQNHARLRNVERPNVPMPDPSLKPLMWGMTCASCGSALQQGPGLPVRDHALLVDGKVLTGAQQQAGPKKEFASASGRLSLAKVVENQHHLTLLPFNCQLCGAPYQHIPQLIGFGTSDGLTPEKFEVDVGGYCSQCGNICAKHIRMGEYVHEGKTILVPLCAVHGTVITPRPGF
jgi:hypothetical protein